MKTREKWLWLFAALSVMIMGFAFFQSFQSREASSQISGAWLTWIRSAFGLSGMEEETLHRIIRKAAHFVEFAALGITVGGFSANLGYLHHRKYIALPAWITLLTAVFDEFIQYFSGRGSMVTDVLLDYSGSLFGFALVALYLHLKNRNLKEKQE